jgi:diguanylate cyclase (GGDEF)-like protein
MDFFTAGVSMIATQLSMALAMFGLWVADRRQAPGAQYWAAASVLISIGIGFVLYDHGANQPAVLIVANASLIWGVVLQYWGLQTFFGLPKGRIGVIVGLSYMTLHSVLLFSGLGLGIRVALFSAFMLGMISITLHLNIKQSRSGPTLGSRLITAALCLVLANNVLRLIAVLLTGDRMRVASPSNLNVVLLYLIPLVGIVLYSVGLLLLYFERSLREQRHLASHDGLTGVLNRRAVVESGAEIMARAVQQKQPLAVSLVDIDYFKRFNDELGHHAGDQVLIEVADLLAGHCRRDDVMGRYGGEEFLLVLPGMPGADCVHLGERLTGAVRQYRYEERHAVTISAGFASLQPGDSWTSLLARADAQLYRAKALGRDQFCIDGISDTRTARSPQTAPGASPAPLGRVIQLKASDPS